MKMERWNGWEGDDFEKMKEFWEGELELINKALETLENRDGQEAVE